MKKEHQEILDLIATYLEKHPSQRFGQALLNLRINEFKNIQNPEKENYQLRDIHNDADSKIIKRIEKQLAWFDQQSNTKS
ncbi:MAG: hypothetical protein GY810_28755 [Aureispira sp.]|nr:hypothetical protein [Aureispira sp.]